MKNQLKENTKQIKKVSLYSLLADFLLAIFKLVVGILGRSDVVIADAIHSFSDTITDGAIILGAKFWSASPDYNHNYGHRRIETVITAGIGVILAFVAFGIAYNRLLVVKNNHDVATTFIAISGPAISIIVKEIFFRWNLHVGKKNNSSSVIANAWHSRSDVYSSIFVFVVVGVSLIDPGLWYIDDIGAIIIAIMIFKMAIEQLWPAITELIDGAASKDQQDKIFDIVSSIEQIKGVDSIRTRKSGSCLIVDLCIYLDKETKLMESSNIKEKAEEQLKKEFPDIIDIIIHVKPFINTKTD